MNKAEKRITIIMIVFLIVITSLLLLTKKETKDDNNTIELKNIEIENKDILLLSDNEKEKCIESLIKYLNKQAYYECYKISFYNNTYDTSTNDKYFYALVFGKDKSLIEITNLGSNQFEYSYIGNELTKDANSEVTGVSYLQIVAPDEYNKEKELEQIREEGITALPDDSEMP